MQTHTNRKQLYASYNWYKQMRETQPFYYDANQGAWQVFHYADVARVLSDHTTFSSNESQYVPSASPDTSPISASIPRMDPPRHLRKPICAQLTGEEALW